MNYMSLRWIDMEPTIRIPVRVALRAAQHLHWLSTLTKDKHSEKMKSISNEITKLIGDQCNLQEVRTAAIAAKLEERA